MPASRRVAANAFALSLPSPVNGGSSRESLKRSACRTRKTRWVELYSDEPSVDCIIAHAVNDPARMGIRTTNLKK